MNSRWTSGRTEWRTGISLGTSVAFMGIL
jgi:hypothetical protein